MKRLGLVACIALLCIGLFGLQTPVFAQSIDSQTVTGQITNNQTGQTTTTTAGTRGDTTANATPPSTTTSPPKSDCGVFGESSIISCIDQGVTFLIKNTFLQIGGFILWLAAQMLNYAIQISVLDFSKWATDALYPTWIVVRKIVSLAVVFAALWTGFMYIIGKDGIFGRVIGWLVLFALFVNFSYPVTRALVDVSNVIALNVYTAAVGPAPLAGTGDATAGGLIMNKLGLQGLIASATAVKESQGSFITDLNSTPAALLAVVFVLYAAYVFLMATGIIAMRTVVLVFLIVASPLLLVDSVVPKLGDIAMKMRELLFQQLMVAPTFMIMLALTLKFMDAFTASGAVVTKTVSSASQLQGGSIAVQTFFSLLIMLIMLHITLKVTKYLSGEVGKFATKAMGQVGGFGLGLATGGAGFLARGSIGAGAAVLRDSKWVDQMQGNVLGRGIYGLSNSLAQSTYDVRNVKAVSSNLKKAGITSIGGVGMQSGLKQNFDQRFKANEEGMLKKASTIKDDTARADYYAQANSRLLNPIKQVSQDSIKKTEDAIHKKREDLLSSYMKAKPEERSNLLLQAGDDYVLREKLGVADRYNLVDGTSSDAASRKVDKLMELKDSDLAEAVIKADPFTDITEQYQKEIERMETDLDATDRNATRIETLADGSQVSINLYKEKQQQLGQKKKELKETVAKKRDELITEYRKRNTSLSGSYENEARATPAETAQRKGRTVNTPSMMSAGQVQAMQQQLAGSIASGTTRPQGRPATVTGSRQMTEREIGAMATQLSSNRPAPPTRTMVPDIDLTQSHRTSNQTTTVGGFMSGEQTESMKQNFNVNLTSLRDRLRNRSQRPNGEAGEGSTNSVPGPRSPSPAPAMVEEAVAA